MPSLHSYTNLTINLFLFFQCPNDFKGSTKSCVSQDNIVFSFKLKRKSTPQQQQLQQQQNRSRLADDQDDFKSGDVATSNAAVAVCHVDTCRDVVVFHKHHISHHSLYEIPPPNYKYDPMRSREKLLWGTLPNPASNCIYCPLLSQISNFTPKYELKNLVDISYFIQVKHNRLLHPISNCTYW